jgi:hypothetical protein
MPTWILIYWIMSATMQNFSAPLQGTGNVEFSDKVACEAALTAMKNNGAMVGGICTPKRMCPEAGADICAVKVNPK